MAKDTEIKEQANAFDNQKFSSKRIASKIAKFAKSQQKPDRAPNARERRKGVTMTPLARKRIPLSRNLPVNMYRQPLTEECLARQIDLEGTTDYRVIMKKLRDWNKANGEDEKSFLPRTAHFDQYFEYEA